MHTETRAQNMGSGGVVTKVEKSKKYTLSWNQEIMQNYVLYCILVYCVLYCIVLYCIVLTSCQVLLWNKQLHTKTG